MNSGNNPPVTKNGNDPRTQVAEPQVKRSRGSWPILVLATLFVIGAFLTWYFTWFGRSLSDEDVSTYIVDYQHPRKVQHALLQIQQRIERKDPSAKQWYPQVVALADNPETELRLAVAWLMGFDHTSQEFHQALAKLLQDSQPIVRRNAALALIKFNDPSGRQELLSILEPYSVRLLTGGVVSSSLTPGSAVSRGALLARLQGPANESVGVRSPLPGKVVELMGQSGKTMAPGDTLLTLSSDEESVWEALRGLGLIGLLEDVEPIKRYLQTPDATERIKQQGEETIRLIQGRKKG